MRLGLHQSCDIHYPAGFFLHGSVCVCVCIARVKSVRVCHVLRTIFWITPHLKMRTSLHQSCEIHQSNIQANNSTPRDETGSATKL